MVDAVPLLPVIAVGVPKTPPAPPSLKVTFTPETGLPELVARALNAVGKVVLTMPDWLFPAVALTASTAAVSVNEVDMYPELLAVIVRVCAEPGSV